MAQDPRFKSHMANFSWTTLQLSMLQIWLLYCNTPYAANNATLKPKSCTVYQPPAPPPLYVLHPSVILDPSTPTTHSQPSPTLQPPPPPLLPHRPPQLPRLLATQRRRRHRPLPLVLPARHRLPKQLPPQLLRQPHHPRTHRRAVPPVLALPPARRNLLGKLPQPPLRGRQPPRRGVARGPPVGREAQSRRDARVARPDDVDDAFFFEALVRVFEGFLVDGFEVGEVALVVEGFAELEAGKGMLRGVDGMGWGWGTYELCAAERLGGLDPDVGFLGERGG